MFYFIPIPFQLKYKICHGKVKEKSYSNQLQKCFHLNAIFANFPNINTIFEHKLRFGKQFTLNRELNSRLNSGNDFMITQLSGAAKCSLIQTKLIALLDLSKIPQKFRI